MTSLSNPFRLGDLTLPNRRAGRPSPRDVPPSPERIKAALGAI
jgi:hypothetical protein